MRVILMIIPLVSTIFETVLGCSSPLQLLLPGGQMSSAKLDHVVFKSVVNLDSHVECAMGYFARKAISA